MINDKLFVSKLYFQTDESNRNELYARLLNEVFFDVKVVNGLILSHYYDFENLGEFFSSKHKWFGIFNIWPDKVITTVNFKIELYDDKIVCRDFEFSDKIVELCQPIYQKRYVKAMFKIFGEDYKRHYKELKTYKITQLQEEEEFLK